MTVAKDEGVDRAEKGVPCPVFREGTISRGSERVPARIYVDEVEGAASAVSCGKPVAVSSFLAMVEASLDRSVLRVEDEKGAPEMPRDDPYMEGADEDLLHEEGANFFTKTGQYQRGHEGTIQKKRWKSFGRAL